MVVVGGGHALQAASDTHYPIELLQILTHDNTGRQCPSSGIYFCLYLLVHFLRWSAVALAELQRCPRGSPGVGKGTGSNPEILKIDGDKTEGFMSVFLFGASLPPSAKMSMPLNCCGSTCVLPALSPLQQPVSPF